MNKHNILNWALTIIGSLSISESATAATPDASLIPLQEWAIQYDQNAPSEVNGHKVYRPHLINGNFTTTALYANPKQSQEQILVNTLMGYVDNAGEQERIKVMDITNKTFTVAFEKIQPQGSENSYWFDLRFRAENGLLAIDVYNIKVNYKLKGFLPVTQNLEKLKPYKNAAEAAAYEEASVLISDIIARYFAEVEANKSEPVTHWAEINDAKIVPGMNGTEVKLIAGSPSDIRKSGESNIRWTFPSNMVVIFNDGKVTRVVN